MKIGVSAFAWTTKLRASHLNLLPILREQGIEGFEVPMFDPADLAALKPRSAFEASGMECTVCAILPAGVNPISDDAAERKRAQEHLRKCVAVAAEAGVKLIAGPVYAPIGYHINQRRTEDEWQRAVECLQSLGDVLDEHAMTLAVEPINRSESMFLNTGADARALCEAVGHARVGVNVDTFHANIEEKSIPDSIRLLGKRLKHIHASENDRGLVGTGHVDFPGMVEALRAIGYDGYLMIEGFGWSADESNTLGALYGDPEVSPEMIAFQGAKYLRRLLQ